jgi:hypothetical protein
MCYVWAIEVQSLWLPKEILHPNSIGNNKKKIRKYEDSSSSEQEKAVKTQNG